MRMKSSWDNRDHGKYKDHLNALIEFIESKIDGLKTGTSGAGEVTLSFELPNNPKVTKSPSFYVRPISTRPETPWLVKRVYDGVNSFCVCENLDDVFDAFNKFPLGFSVWTGRKNSISIDASASKSTAAPSDRLSKRSTVVEKLLFLINELNYDQDKFSNKVNRELLDVLLWKYSEADGAKLGNKFWTKNAIDLYENLKTLQGLVHEHTVPRKVLLNQLLTHKNWTIESLGDFLARFCFATVVTKEEDILLNGAKLRSSMPTGWTFEVGDPFARYHVAGLSKVIDQDMK